MKVVVGGHSVEDASDPWRHAKHMPQVDHDLKALITVRFDSKYFRRLGQIQNDLKRLNYV